MCKTTPSSLSSSSTRHKSALDYTEARKVFGATSVLSEDKLTHQVMSASMGVAAISLEASHGLRKSRDLTLVLPDQASILYLRPGLELFGAYFVQFMVRQGPVNNASYPSVVANLHSTLLTQHKKAGK